MTTWIINEGTKTAPILVTYRQMTSAEAREMRHGQFITADRTAVKNIRRTGATKLWKTRPTDYRVPVKYGLYESSALIPSGVDPTLAVLEFSNGALPVMREETV